MPCPENMLELMDIAPVVDGKFVDLDLLLILEADFSCVFGLCRKLLTYKQDVIFTQLLEKNAWICDATFCLDLFKCMYFKKTF